MSVSALQTIRMSNICQNPSSEGQSIEEVIPPPQSTVAWASRTECCRLCISLVYVYAEIYMYKDAVAQISRLMSS